MHLHGDENEFQLSEMNVQE